MAAPDQQQWAFVADWLDPSSGVQWSFQLFAFVDPARQDVEVALFDTKNQRFFLRRVKCPGLTASQLYLGARVTIFGRQLHLTAHADEATRRALEARAERTLALVKPEAFQRAGRIIQAISSSGFSITNLRMCQLSQGDALAFCHESHRCSAGAPPDSRLAAALSSGPVVALELMAPSGVRKWLDIRAVQLGSDALHSAVHGSANRAAAAAELAFFFGHPSSTPSSSSSSGSGQGAHTAGRLGGTPASGSASGTTAVRVASACRCRDTTLGVVLPHAVKEGVAGTVLAEIQATGRFEVTGLQQLSLGKQAAAEFLEVYKGVVPPGEHGAMVDELAAGPCIAVEVATRDGRPPVEAFRELVGPRDPELGRVLRPRTLRARFGASRVRNAVHCTDLEEDGSLESSYFFSVLQAAH